MKPNTQNTADSQRVAPEDWRASRRELLRDRFSLSAEDVDRLLPPAAQEQQVLGSERSATIRRALPSLGHFGGDASGASVTIVERGGLRVTPVAPRPVPIADAAGQIRLRMRAPDNLSAAAIDSSVVLHLVDSAGRSKAYPGLVTWEATEDPVWTASFSIEDPDAADGAFDGYELQRAVVLIKLESA